MGHNLKKKKELEIQKKSTGKGKMGGWGVVGRKIKESDTSGYSVLYIYCLYIIMEFSFHEI
jgi:hypothetical protein